MHAAPWFNCQIDAWLIKINQLSLLRLSSNMIHCGNDPGENLIVEVRRIARVFNAQGI